MQEQYSVPHKECPFQERETTLSSFLISHELVCRARSVSVVHHNSILLVSHKLLLSCELLNRVYYCTTNSVYISIRVIIHRNDDHGQWSISLLWIKWREVKKAIFGLDITARTWLCQMCETRGAWTIFLLKTFAHTFSLTSTQLPSYHALLRLIEDSQLKLP